MVEAVVEEGAAPENSEPKKSKVLFYVVLALLVLVGGGGGAAFYFLKAKPDATEKGAKHEVKHAVPKSPALYISLDPPFVVNFESQQNVRFLQVTVQVMTRDAATQALIKENDPIIRNNLLLLLGTQKYESVATREGKEELRTQALDVVRKALQEEGGKPELVEAVYFTSFVMQ